jgi:hypothetical protein
MRPYGEHTEHWVSLFTPEMEKQRPMEARELGQEDQVHTTPRHSAQGSNTFLMLVFLVHNFAYWLSKCYYFLYLFEESNVLNLGSFQMFVL